MEIQHLDEDFINIVIVTDNIGSDFAFQFFGDFLSEDAQQQILADEEGDEILEHIYDYLSCFVEPEIYDAEEPCLEITRRIQVGANVFLTITLTDELIEFIDGYDSSEDIHELIFGEEQEVEETYSEQEDEAEEDLGEDEDEWDIT